MYFHWADLIIRDRTWPIPWDPGSIALGDRLHDRCSQTVHHTHIHPNNNQLCISRFPNGVWLRKIMIWDIEEMVILTADFHVAKGWRLRHWLAALRKWGGPRPAGHLQDPATILIGSFNTTVNIWVPNKLLFTKMKENSSVAILMQWIQRWSADWRWRYPLNMPFKALYKTN